MRRFVVTRAEAWVEKWPSGRHSGEKSPPKRLEYAICCSQYVSMASMVDSAFQMWRIEISQVILPFLNELKCESTEKRFAGM